MTTLTKEEIIEVAGRAMLAITDAEAEMFAKDLSTLIEYSDMLDALDTENVEPMTHVITQKNVMREDVVANVLDRDEMLQSVEEHQDGAILVPTILS